MLIEIATELRELGRLDEARQILQEKLPHYNIPFVEIDPHRKIWGVITTHHTLFIAHLISERLKRHGCNVEVMTEAPRSFDHDWYVVLCPQMFERLPPSKKRIVYQLEQSVSSRWFTNKYLGTDRLYRQIQTTPYRSENIIDIIENGVIKNRV